MPNFGTTQHKHKAAIIHKPTVAAPQNLAELFEEYKTFSLLKKKDDMASNMAVDTEAFVISLDWLRKYSNFILFDQFKSQKGDMESGISQTHFEDMHPGPIMTASEIIEQDKNGRNLYGTGTIKGFESEYID